MHWIVKIILECIIEKFFEQAIIVFQNAAIKRGINLKAKKSLEAIKQGDAYLHQGNLQGWLDQLNKEQV